MPINWCFYIAHDLRLKGHIGADVLVNSLLQEVKLFKEKLQILCNYDWVPVPLAYPQVVFLAVRIYLFLYLFGRQYRYHYAVAHPDDPDSDQIAMEEYFPLMTLLEMFFYMGWLKVAEALLNPLGEDDDDFECNYIIDRNIAIGMAMVDECYECYALVGRISNISMKKLRILHHSLSLSHPGDEAKRSNGKNTHGVSNKLKGKTKIGDMTHTTTASGRTSEFDHFDPIIGKESGPKPMGLGLHSISTAPELRYQSSPTSPTADLRSLQLHPLETLEEVEADDNEEKRRHSSAISNTAGGSCTLVQFDLASGNEAEHENDQ